MRVDIEKKRYPGKTYDALRNIHVAFPPGYSTLILGTSGAGKSTLIKCMIGMTSFEGEITEYRREDIAYIPQHPALNRKETAHDAIFWSARFSRLYRGSQELHDAVQYYIHTMGLDSVQNSPIDKLSGGQMQRVSIAKELIRGKNIIIADEIDTGLDCGVSRFLISKLRDITHETGKTTVIISHNIVNIELYDRVIVLAKGSDETGGIAYAGSPAYIRGFFEVSDYVDILTRINTEDEGGKEEADIFIKRFDELRRRR